MASIFKDFYFYISADLPLDFKLYVDHMDTSQLPPDACESPEELVVTARLIDGGIPLTSCVRATHTPYAQGGCVVWGEWLALPIKIRDLPKTAQLVVELWGVGMRLIGGMTLRVFDHRLRLKRGLSKCVLWPARTQPRADLWARHGPEDADAADITSVDTLVLPTSVPARPSVRAVDLVWSDAELCVLKQLEAWELNEVHRSPWVDRMAMNQLAKDLMHAKKEQTARATRRCRSAGPAQRVAARDSAGPVQGPIFLYLHFPAFDYPVIFEDVVYPHVQSAPVPPLLPPQPQKFTVAPRAPVTKSTRTAVPAADAAAAGPAAFADGVPPELFGSVYTPYWYENGSFAMIVDPEIGVENPAEVKYHKLARMLMRNVVDTNLKPSTRELARINEALSGSTLDIRLTADVKDLLWRFRYSLTSNKKALVKFLLCVDWDEEEDAREALSLLPRWAPVDTEDALRLLSSDFRLRAVREYAANALARASDEEVALYLLQLVQALRYEPELMAADATATSPLVEFLLQRCCHSVELGNFLYWFLTVELEDQRMGPMFSRVHRSFLDRLTASPRGREIEAVISAQGVFLQQLAAAISNATGGKGNIPSKIRKLNDILRPGGAFGELCALTEPVPLPLLPGILTSGVFPGECNIFKSALYPTVVTLAVHPLSRIDWASRPTTQGLSIHPDAAEAAAAAIASLPPQIRATLTSRSAPTRSRAPISGAAAAAAAEEELANAAAADLVAATVTAAVTGSMSGPAPPATYKVIFKNGDDLRQDQLIIQMIRLMDQQLKRVGLDLRLTPYRVIATSTSSGIMEMVLHSKPVSKVLADYNNNIMAFFREHHPSPTDEYGIDRDTMDTYVKSCAGYCVITYLLGVGDRHLDNIMLTRDGHLFHLDFGYIFGRDPKPLVAPIRLTKEMLDAMGGPESANYQSFTRYACKAYNILRKSANLVLTLLHLMRDAGIECLSEQTDMTLAKLQDKFRLDIQDDEAADAVFLKLLDDSAAAFFPALWEVLHKVRVAMR